jgi:hypothetical protein
MPEVKTKVKQGYSTEQYCINYYSEVIDTFDKELTELLEKYRI